MLEDEKLRIPPPEQFHGTNQPHSYCSFIGIDVWSDLCSQVRVTAGRLATGSHSWATTAHKGTCSTFHAA
eukprot:6257391-Amphidinium_carterae.1